MVRGTVRVRVGVMVRVGVRVEESEPHHYICRGGYMPCAGGIRALSLYMQGGYMPCAGGIRASSFSVRSPASLGDFMGGGI